MVDKYRCVYDDPWAPFEYPDTFTVSLSEAFRELADSGNVTSLAGLSTGECVVTVVYHSFAYAEGSTWYISAKSRKIALPNPQ